jgi:alpha-N-arabinofuranosidase
MWGPWQVEQHSKEDYAKKAYQWAKALKLQDPAIKLILCGKNGHSDWDRYVLQKCIKYTDMHSIHMYTSDKNHYANACSPRAAERAIEITASLIDLARCDFDYETWPDSISTKAKTPHKPTICFDEWNIWDPVAAPGDKGGEQLYDVSDMLAVASWLNVFVRQAKYMGMATVAQSVNVISPLMTTTMDLPLMDVSAALDDEGYVNLAVVNLHESDAAETKLPAIKGPVKVFVVGGNVNGIRDNNVEGNEKVYIRESKWQGGESFSFERHSFTLLRWKAEGASSWNGSAVGGVNGVSHEPTNGFHDEPAAIMAPVEYTNSSS